MNTQDARKALTDRLQSAMQHADDEQIHQCVDLLVGDKAPDDIKATADWMDQCYHRPRDKEGVMHALNEVLEGHGVEHITLDKVQYPEDDGGGIFEPVMAEADVEAEFDYLNMGDTYIATLIEMDGEWYVTSWGDMVEALEGAAVADAKGIDWSKEAIANPYPMPTALTALIEAAMPPSPDTPHHQAPSMPSPGM